MERRRRSLLLYWQLRVARKNTLIYSAFRIRINKIPEQMKLQYAVRKKNRPVLEKNFESVSELKKIKKELLSLKKSRKWGELLAELRKTGTVLLAMMFLGLVLDLIYWVPYKICGCYNWSVIELFRKMHITYGNAYKVIDGNFGVTVTIVSMFLSMNNSISERLEKKVFGITRSELYPEEMPIYKYLRRICLCAPVLLLVFLNLQFCISCYFVFVYCITFLMWNYYKYGSSFNKTTDKMAAKLIEDLPQDSKWTEESLSQYLIVLERIRRSVEKDGNWKEAEELFCKLRESVRRYDYIQQNVICYYFYKTVFFRDDEESKAISLQMLRTCIKDMDVGVSRSGQMTEDQWAEFIGMTRAFLCEADEESVVRFLEYFMDFPERSCNVMICTDDLSVLPIDVIEKQMGVLLILLEYRFKLRLLKSTQLADWLKEIWMYGSDFFTDNRTEIFHQISSFNESLFAKDKGIFKTIFENLSDDCSIHSIKSYIAQIIFT